MVLLEGMPRWSCLPKLHFLVIFSPIAHDVVNQSRTCASDRRATSKSKHEEYLPIGSDSVSKDSVEGNLKVYFGYFIEASPKLCLPFLLIPWFLLSFPQRRTENEIVKQFHNIIIRWLISTYDKFYFHICWDVQRHRDLSASSQCHRSKNLICRHLLSLLHFLLQTQTTVHPRGPLQLTCFYFRNWTFLITLSQSIKYYLVARFVCVVSNYINNLSCSSSFGCSLLGFLRVKCVILLYLIRPASIAPTFTILSLVPSIRFLFSLPLFLLPVTAVSSKTSCHFSKHFHLFELLGISSPFRMHMQGCHKYSCFHFQTPPKAHRTSTLAPAFKKSVLRERNANPTFGHDTEQEQDLVCLTYFLPYNLLAKSHESVVSIPFGDEKSFTIENKLFK